MKPSVETSVGVIFFLLAVVLIVARMLTGCYRGDPGYGGPDYPPEPPFSETCADAGRG